MCNLHERLLKERKSLKKNQAKMASLGGVAKRTYCNYESGQREPMASFYSAIAAAGADVQYILTGTRSINLAKEPETIEDAQKLVKATTEAVISSGLTEAEEMAVRDLQIAMQLKNKELMDDARDRLNELKPREKALLDNYRNTAEEEDKRAIERTAVMAVRAADKDETQPGKKSA